MLERLAANLSGRGCSKLGGVVFATRTTVGAGVDGKGEVCETRKPSVL